MPRRARPAAAAGLPAPRAIPRRKAPQPALSPAKATSSVSSKQAEKRTAEHAGQAHLVARAIDRPQQIQQIVDFLLGVEGMSADEVIVDAVAPQGLFVVFHVRQRANSRAMSPCRTARTAGWPAWSLFGVASGRGSIARRSSRPRRAWRGFAGRSNRPRAGGAARVAPCRPSGPSPSDARPRERVRVRAFRGESSGPPSPWPSPGGRGHAATPRGTPPPASGRSADGAAEAARSPAPTPRRTAH